MAMCHVLHVEWPPKDDINSDTPEVGQKQFVSFPHRWASDLFGTRNAFMYDGPLIFKKLFGNQHAGILFTLVSGPLRKNRVWKERGRCFK